MTGDRCPSKGEINETSSVIRPKWHDKRSSYIFPNRKDKRNSSVINELYAIVSKRLKKMKSCSYRGDKNAMCKMRWES